MMNKTRHRQLKPDPMMIPDPLALFPDPMRRPGESHDGQDLILTASIAASVSAQGATGGGDTVATPIVQLPTASGISNPHDVTFTNTKRHTSKHPTVKMCEWCLHEFMPRRPHGRFCSAYCRREAWLDRNPDKAAALAASDMARLKAHFEETGREWREDTRVERCSNGA